MADIIISAPGKVILHGEHAVVYGKKAIAASLDLRTFFRLRPNEKNVVSVELPDIGLKAKWSTHDLLGIVSKDTGSPYNPGPPSEEKLKQLKLFLELDHQSEIQTKQLALVAFLHLYCSISAKDGQLPSFDILLSSKLPTGAGLGSSAAFSTCLAAGLLTLCKHVHTDEGAPSTNGHLSWSGKHLTLINQWAFEAEKIIHGNPSGIDNSISCYGGALNFQGGQISPLKKVPKLRVLLFNTKVPRSTKVLVAGVRTKYNKFQTVLEPMMAAIEEITKQCEDLFSRMQADNSLETYTSLQDLIELNQHLLGGLGVSHPAIEEICQLTARYGLSSKLTGAGGGGCVFALIPPGFDASVISALHEEVVSHGYDSWETTVGGLGVVRHRTLPHTTSDTSGFVPPDSFTMSDSTSFIL